MASKETDQTRSEMSKVENVIGVIMQIGVLASAIVIIIGLLMFFITGQSGYTGNNFPHTFAVIGRGLVYFKPYAIIMLGLFLLILTPALRVLVSIYAFAVMKDRMYVLITSLVMVILVIAMVIGMYGI
ncbi:DUF1634 domain-containing protein [Limosilactobacillus coleohominis]|uniref:DUF1634 domain-containing protein n=1 Tax=Limosilactobacillus coleohominis TaxID=181675 RepID=UPI00195DFA79|nr:DUF1634 domain-containing protein [Limosilactobacillus coleohominis]MBM6955091.1 DUF1634 domain-containing protein [Limosilactobacillus coleohominis]HJA24226.1 DUF1634 domain-containing protein [Candidatus Limosilactobacillus intestinavium]